MLTSSLNDLPRLWTSENGYISVLFISIFFTFSFGSLITVRVAKFLKENLEPEEALSLIPMSGIIGIIFFAYPILLFGAAAGKDPIPRLIIPAISLSLFVLEVRRLLKIRNFHLRLISSSFILSALFLGFLAVRLVFINGLALPPYSDSVEHYQIIHDLLHPDNSPLAFYKVTRLFTRYYHFGFHSLAAWVSTLTRYPVQDTMMILGQILQAVIPISLFFPVKIITKSNTAGLLTVLLAGICWRMPGFASNWGKYPALTGLAIFPFSPGVLLLAGITTNRKNKFTLIAIALIGGLISVLTHSRTAIMFIIIFAGWWVSGKLSRLHSSAKSMTTIFLILAIYWTGNQITQTPLLSTILSPYLRDGFYATLGVFLLIPFSLKLHPRLTSSMLLFLLFILSAALWPISIPIRSFENTYLFDRPFAQLIIFIPLSVLGGSGFAGLFDHFHQLLGRESKFKLLRYLPILLPVFLVFYSLTHYEYTPSSCCQLADRDDITAYDWIEKNLPGSSKILIAGNRTPSRYYGVDGGIWITPLTGHKTAMMSNTLVFDSNLTLEQLCEQQITYIYAGGTNTRFSLEQIYSKRDWYKNIFTNSTVNIYEITGCRQK